MGVLFQWVEVAVLISYLIIISLFPNAGVYNCMYTCMLIYNVTMLTLKLVTSVSPKSIHVSMKLLYCVQGF